MNSKIEDLKTVIQQFSRVSQDLLSENESLQEKNELLKKQLTESEENGREQKQEIKTLRGKIDSWKDDYFVLEANIKEENRRLDKDNKALKKKNDRLEEEREELNRRFEEVLNQLSSLNLIKDTVYSEIQNIQETVKNWMQDIQNGIHMLHEQFDQEGEELIEPEDGIDDSCNYGDNAGEQDVPEEDAFDKSESCNYGDNADGQDTSEEDSKDTSDESESCNYDDNVYGQGASEENSKDDAFDKSESCNYDDNVGEREELEESTESEDFKYDGNSAFNGDGCGIKPYDSTIGELHDDDDNSF